MRISDPKNSLSRAIESRSLSKIEKFPSQKTDIKGPAKSGIIIDISDHAQKIKQQNESILSKAISEEMGSKRIFEIRNRMDNGFYNSQEVVQKIADGILSELALMS